MRRLTSAHCATVRVGVRAANADRCGRAWGLFGGAEHFRGMPGCAQRPLLSSGRFALGLPEARGRGRLALIVVRVAA